MTEINSSSRQENWVRNSRMIVSYGCSGMDRIWLRVQMISNGMVGSGRSWITSSHLRSQRSDHPRDLKVILWYSISQISHSLLRHKRWWTLDESSGKRIFPESIRIVWEKSTSWIVQTSDGIRSAMHSSDEMNRVMLHPWASRASRKHIRLSVRNSDRWCMNWDFWEYKYKYTKYTIIDTLCKGFFLMRSSFRI